MTKAEKRLSSSCDDLEKALAICDHSKRSSLTPDEKLTYYLEWRSQRWLDVKEHFGEMKTRVMFEALEMILTQFGDFEETFLKMHETAPNLHHRLILAIGC